MTTALEFMSQGVHFPRRGFISRDIEGPEGRPDLFEALRVEIARRVPLLQDLEAARHLVIKQRCEAGLPVDYAAANPEKKRPASMSVPYGVCETCGDDLLAGRGGMCELCALARVKVCGVTAVAAPRLTYRLEATP